LGNHTGIDAYQAQLLSNSELNTLQKKLYGIKSTIVYDYMSGSQNHDELAEGLEVIIETNSMPRADMISAMQFNFFINTYHIQGLTLWLSRFVYKHLEIDYSVFYDRLYQFLEQDPWFRQELEEFTYYVEAWMRDGKIGHPNIANIEIHGWNLNNRAIINLHVGDKKQHVMKTLEHFMTQFDLDAGVLSDLIKLQSAYIIEFGQLKNYPQQVNFEYNIHDYLMNDVALEKQSYSLKIDFDKYLNSDADMDFDLFLERIYYGRRRNFGKAVIAQIALDNELAA
jgi:hypothetical protein